MGQFLPRYEKDIKQALNVKPSLDMGSSLDPIRDIFDKCQVKNEMEEDTLINTRPDSFLENILDPAKALRDSIMVRKSSDPIRTIFNEATCSVEPRDMCTEDNEHCTRHRVPSFLDQLLNPMKRLTKPLRRSKNRSRQKLVLQNGYLYKAEKRRFC